MISIVSSSVNPYKLPRFETKGRLILGLAVFGSRNVPRGASKARAGTCSRLDSCQREAICVAGACQCTEYCCEDPGVTFFSNTLPQTDCMDLRAKQDILGIAITQLCILNAAWAFFIVISIKNPLPLPDVTAKWVYQNPTETTIVVTVVATVMSSMTLR